MLQTAHCWAMLHKYVSLLIDFNIKSCWSCTFWFLYMKMSVALKFLKTLDLTFDVYKFVQLANSFHSALPILRPDRHDVWRRHDAHLAVMVTWSNSSGADVWLRWTEHWSQTWRRWRTVPSTYNGCWCQMANSENNKGYKLMKNESIQYMQCLVRILIKGKEKPMVLTHVLW